MATTKDEARIIKAVEQVIAYTSEGMSPNTAIEKVAKAEGLGPGQIETVVSAYNKSKAVCMLKPAGDNRNQTFELADPSLILGNIFGTPTIEKAAFSLPRINLTDVDFPRPKLEKAASSENKTPSDREVFHKLQKHAQVQKMLENKLHDAVAKAQYDFCQSLEKVAELLKPMADRDLQKVANIVVNGYQEQGAGQKFMELCCAKLKRDTIKLQKTASAAVFPVKEPYISISNLFKHAAELTKAKNNKVFFSKEAAYSVMKDLATNVTSDMIMGVTGREGTSAIEKLIGSAPKGEVLEDILNAEHYNKLKALDAKRNLMEIALYDKHLNKYDLEVLVEAFNDVVGLNPKAYNNKPLLKNLMLSHIESGGVRGLYELGAEVSLAKALDEREQIRDNLDIIKSKETRERKQEQREEDKLKLEKKKSKDADKDFNYRKQSDEAKARLEADKLNASNRYERAKVNLTRKGLEITEAKREQDYDVASARDALERLKMRTGTIKTHNPTTQTDTTIPRHPVIPADWEPMPKFKSLYTGV